MPSAPIAVEAVETVARPAPVEAVPARELVREQIVRLVAAHRLLHALAAPAHRDDARAAFELPREPVDRPPQRRLGEGVEDLRADDRAPRARRNLLPKARLQQLDVLDARNAPSRKLDRARGEVDRHA